MRVIASILFLSFQLAYCQVRFFPIPKPGDLVERFFKESSTISEAKKRNFRIFIDEKNGRIEYSWTEKAKKIKKYKYMNNVILAELECKLEGREFPVVFSYNFKMDSPCRERSIFWEIESFCKDTNLFGLVDGSSNKYEHKGYEIYAYNVPMKSFRERYGYYIRGDAMRDNNSPVEDFSFCWKYKSSCLPCVVLCCMRGSRSGLDSRFGESDPEFMTEFREFVTDKNKIDFDREYRTTLGPGLDAKQSKRHEIVDELIKNIQLAKNNNWMTWNDDFEKLLQNIKDIKYAIQIKNQNVLNQKIKSSYLNLNNVKNVGRREFFAMVDIYLATLEKKSD